jgi:hypothetical protein
MDTDEHVLAAVVIGITDDRSVCGGVSTLQVKQLVGKLDVPDPVSTWKWDRHDKMRCDK